MYVPDSVPPATPTGVTASAKENAVNLTWSANKEPDLQGYKVYRGDSEKGKFIGITSIPLTEPRFSEPIPAGIEGDIWYQVSAIDNDNNESPPSATVKLALPNVRPPDAPQVLFARSEADATVTIKWATGISPDLAGWILERSESDAPNAKWEVLNGGKQFPKETTEFRDTQVIAGKKYFYRVTALDSAGLRTSPSEPMGALVRKTTPPPAPTGVTARVEPGTIGVVLAWDLTPAKDAASYRVYRTGAADGPWNPIALTVPPNVISVIDTSAQGGVTYFYRVTVFDTAGNESDPSAAVSARVEG